MMTFWDRAVGPLTIAVIMSLLAVGFFVRQPAIAQGTGDVERPSTAGRPSAGQTQAEDGKQPCPTLEAVEGSGATILAIFKCYDPERRRINIGFGSSMVALGEEAVITARLPAGGEAGGKFDPSESTIFAAVQLGDETAEFLRPTIVKDEVEGGTRTLTLALVPRAGGIGSSGGVASGIFGTLDLHMIVCENGLASCAADGPLFLGHAQSRAMGAWTGGAFALIVLLLIYGIAVFAKGEPPDDNISRANPVYVTSGITGRGSISNFQILLVSLTVFPLMAYVLARTGELTDLSLTIVGLLGVTLVGGVAARFVANARAGIRPSNVHWLMDIGWVERQRPKWADLFQKDGEIALDRLQAFAVLILICIALIIRGGSELAEFSVPENVLAILAASQTVYIAGKYARDGKAEIKAQTDLNEKISSVRKKWINFEDYGRLDATGGKPLKPTDPAVVAYLDEVRDLGIRLKQADLVASEHDLVGPKPPGGSRIPL